jgi:hypothetical protein
MNNPRLFEESYPHSGKDGYVTDITLLDLFAGIAFHSLHQMACIKRHENEIRKRAEQAKMTPENYLAKEAYKWGKTLLKERESIMKGESNAKKTS